MKLFISGKFSTEVFDQAYDLVNLLTDSLDMNAINLVETNLSLFVYFQVIFSDQLGIKRKSLRRYSKSECSEGVNSEIPVGRWIVSSGRERINLLVDSLCAAIMDTSSSKIPDASKLIICREINKAKAKILSDQANL